MHYQRGQGRFPAWWPAGLATFLLTFGLVALLLPGEAKACSCMRPAPPDEALEAAEAVFFGEVLTVEAVAHGLRVNIQVEHGWKGVDGDRVEVWTASSGASCGVSFRPGETYLVYAESFDDRLGASLCSRTRQTSWESAVGELGTHGGDEDSAEGLVNEGATGHGSDANWTAVVDPVTTALSFVHIQLERRLADGWTLYAGPHLRLFDGVSTPEDESYRGYGAELGVRYYPFGDAIDGMWVGLRGVGAMVTPADSASAARSFGGYASGLVGYTWILQDRFVLSGGAGIQYINYGVDGMGNDTLFPALHTAFGVAF